MRNSDMNVHLSYIFFLLSCSQLFPNLNPFIERDVLKKPNSSILQSKAKHIYICTYACITHSFYFCIKYRIVNYLC